MKKITINILLLSLVVIFVSSCNKKSSASLQGDWEMIYLQENPPTGETQVWTFDGNTKLEVKIIKEDTTLITTGTYYYYSKSLKKDQMDIAGLGYIYDGKYNIHKFKNGNLQIQRIELTSGDKDGAFRWFDFTKKE